jgi:predicted nuclease of predicted toxin-antitoxin system
MRFLVDECTGTSVANWLKNENHEVFSVFEQWRGASDDAILEKCHQENYILITSDKDFGEMVFRNQKVHNGIILVRCNPNNFVKRIEVLSKLLKNYPDKLENNFVVVSNESVRIVEVN